FLLSTLRIRPYDRARKTRSRRGWLGLRRTTLSFAASCRIRCRRLCLLHQLWWCKHAAYGIGLTLRHFTPLPIRDQGEAFRRRAEAISGRQPAAEILSRSDGSRNSLFVNTLHISHYS